MGHWSWRKKKNKKKKENVPQNEVVQEAESVTGEPTMALMKNVLAQWEIPPKKCLLMGWKKTIAKR